MKNTKQKPVDIMKAIADDPSLEDELYNMYIEHKIAMGLKAFEEGKFISHEELRKEVETWS